MSKGLRGSVAVLALFGSLLTPAWAGAATGEGTPTMGPKEDMGDLNSSMSEEALEVARLHFKNGVALLQSEPPNYQDAYYQFQLALEKSSGSWKVRGNLGFCALKLERDGEALDHYGEYLREGGDAIDPEERKDIVSELLLLQGNLATVAITSSDPTAQITVERSGSTAPVQPYQLVNGKAKLGLRAGAFTITAKSGATTREWKQVLTPGQKAEFHFDFEANEAAPTAPLAPEEPSTTDSDGAAPPKRSSPLRLAGYATASVGVLALGGGVVTGLLAKSSESKAKEDCLDKICPSSGEGKKNSAESLATTANILFIAGGVLAATGVTLVVLGGTEQSKDTARLEFTPGFGPQGGALFARGSF
jgi:hypothetical protein